MQVEALCTLCKWHSWHVIRNGGIRHTSHVTRHTSHVTRCAGMAFKGDAFDENVARTTLSCNVYGVYVCVWCMYVYGMYECFWCVCMSMVCMYVYACACTCVHVYACVCMRDVFPPHPPPPCPQAPSASHQHCCRSSPQEVM